MADVSEVIRALLAGDKPQSRYPNRDDAQFAAAQDFSYGKPWASNFTDQQYNVLTGDPNAVLRGKPVQSEIQSGDYLKSMPDSLGQHPADNFYKKAALATNRSALASLGFDPSKAALDFNMGPHATIYGAYSPKTDEIYSNALHPSNIVHESIHRGMEHLKNSPYWKSEFGYLDPEMVVRHLMKTKMGDPETVVGADNPGQQQINEATKMFEGPEGMFQPGANRRRILADMETAASKYIAAKNPRGPR